VLADIGPGEGVCQDSLLAEVRAESLEERTPKKCIRGEGMMDETAAPPSCKQLSGYYW